MSTITETAINKTEIKKELYRTKVEANFSHYAAGNLYYTVKIGEDVYQFPISVMQSKDEITINGVTFKADSTTQTSHTVGLIDLSKDLGDTYFKAAIRASELNRWIDKAIDKGLFVKISV